MELFYRIVTLLGGLAMFLYGMRLMGDGLKSSSGGAMRAALEKITDKPIKAFILGLFVTCMIQSSTATIVLTVGLVGAEFITFRQSIGIVLGANVGTAITAQIIRLMDVNASSDSILYFFKSDNLAPLSLIIGIILIMFVKGIQYKTAGTICIGFGVLFSGLMNMSAAVSTMQDELQGFIISFQDSYVLGFFAGIITTGIIQSSSAVIGILQSIASSMGLQLCGIVAVIIGVNIGDCLTTYLVCRIGANTAQIRTCMVHIIYNIFAAILITVSLIVLRATGILSDDIWYMTLNSGGVANVHGLFRLAPAVISLPFVGMFASLAEKIVPEKHEEEDEKDPLLEENLRKLDARLIDNPTLALNESAILIGNMCDVSIHNYTAAIQQLFEYDPKRETRIQRREDLLDRMADAVSQYIVSVSPKISLDSDKKNQDFQLKACVCFERIGDLAVNIIDCLATVRNANKAFSGAALKEMEVAMNAVSEILDMTAEAYYNNDIKIAKKIEPLEEVIDEIVESLQGRHMRRMTENRCDVFNGTYYQNILLNLERVSDQCSDLAVYLLARNDDSISGREHQYLHNLHHSNNTNYKQAFKSFYKKYFDQLNEIPEV
ncbi:MAG: Na/Pi cotransporter family protein [Eubacterium sp.]|nr:Na/Pi cotransporter family protein [Eubacterium sp.]